MLTPSILVHTGSGPNTETRRSRIPMSALLHLCAGALTATLTELHEPFGLNDNLTIPIFSSLAMQWAFSRIQG
jgi:hypothetical protein